MNSYIVESDVFVPNSKGIQRFSLDSLQVICQYGVDLQNEEITCCYAEKNFLFIGTNLGDVLQLNPESMEVIRKITRRMSSVSGLCLLGNVLITAGEDTEIKLFDLNSISSSVSLDSHFNPLVSIDSNVKSYKIASLDSSGLLMIWDASTLLNNGIYEKTQTELTPLHSIVGLELCEGHHSVSFNSSGDFLLSSNSKEVRIFKMKDYSLAFSLPILEGSDRFNHAIWSPDGNHIGLLAGLQIHIYSIGSAMTLLQKIPLDSVIHNISWSYDGTRLLSHVQDGTLSWINVLDSTKTSTKRKGYVSDEADSDLDLDDILNSEREEDEEQSSNTADDQNLDSSSDQNSDVQNMNIGNSLLTGRRGEGHIIRARHPVIHPGSTPFINGRRFLACTNVGYVILREEDEYSSTIDVEFHDVYGNRAIRIPNERGYSMAYLNDFGVVLATGLESSGNGFVKFHRYDSSTHGHWNVDLPADEHCIGVCSSSKYIFVASSKQKIYGFTVSGLQWFPLPIVGEFISMAAFNSSLFIIHSKGTDIKCSLYDYENFQLVGSVEVPIAQSNMLSWIGFTDTGLPTIYDSQGALKVLYPERGFIWAELFRLTDSIYKAIWPVGFDFESGSIVVVDLSSSSSPHYPDPTVRPVMTPIELSLGLIPDGYAKMNQVLLQNLNSTTTNSDDGAVDRVLTELILTAIKKGSLMKALDYCSLLKLETSMEIATKLAMHYNYPQLVGRINSLRDRMFPDTYNDSGDQYTSVLHETPPSNRQETCIPDDEGDENKENSECEIISGRPKAVIADLTKENKVANNKNNVVKSKLSNVNTERKSK